MRLALTLLAHLIGQRCPWCWEKHLDLRGHVGAEHAEVSL